MCTNTVLLLINVCKLLQNYGEKNPRNSITSLNDHFSMFKQVSLNSYVKVYSSRKLIKRSIHFILSLKDIFDTAFEPGLAHKSRPRYFPVGKSGIYRPGKYSVKLTILGNTGKYHFSSFKV